MRLGKTSDHRKPGQVIRRLFSPRTGAVPVPGGAEQVLASGADAGGVVGGAGDLANAPVMGRRLSILLRRPSTSGEPEAGWSAPVSGRFRGHSRCPADH